MILWDRESGGGGKGGGRNGGGRGGDGEAEGELGLGEEEGWLEGVWGIRRGWGGGFSCSGIIVWF